MPIWPAAQQLCAQRLLFDPEDSRRAVQTGETGRRAGSERRDQLSRVPRFETAHHVADYLHAVELERARQNPRRQGAFDHAAVVLGAHLAGLVGDFAAVGDDQGGVGGHLDRPHADRIELDKERMIAPPQNRDRLIHRAAHRADVPFAARDHLRRFD